MCCSKVTKLCYTYCVWVVICGSMYFSNGRMNVDVPIALQSKSLSLPSLSDRIGGYAGDRAGDRIYSDSQIFRFGAI